MKLNKTIRQRIINAVMQGVYTPKDKALRAENQAIYLKIRAVILGHLHMAYNALPYDWKTTYREVLIRGAGNLYLRFNGEEYCPKYCYLLDDLTPYLREEVLAHGEARDTLDREWNLLRENAEAVINSVTTIKRLLEVWPEGWAYIENAEAARPIQSKLPAIPVPALNAMLQKFKGE